MSTSNFDINNMIFVHFGNSTILTGLKYNAANGLILNKPKNIFWASPYTPTNQYKSEWEEYCINHNMHNKVADSAFFRLKSNANILVIDSIDDLCKLDHKYIDKDLILDHKVTSNIFNMANIMLDFNGIYISRKGLEECNHIFYEWEVPSLGLFNCDMVVRICEEHL